MEPRQITTIYPKDVSQLRQRLWRRGAKRFARLAFQSEAVLLEKPASREEVAGLAKQAAIGGQHVLLATSLFDAPAERASFLTPPTIQAPAVSTAPVPPAKEVVQAPSMAHWAFSQAPTMPERVQSAEKGNKPLRAAIVFNARLAAPQQRNARSQAFVEFMKWELAEILDELVVKHHVHLLTPDANTDKFWDIYDLALRSRKAELLRMSFMVTDDEHMDVAANSHLVVTDNAELAFSCLGLGRKVVLLGGQPLPKAGPSAWGGRFLHLPDFSSNAHGLRSLVASEPVLSRPEPIELALAEATVRMALSSGHVVVHA